jgi:hypothetical protein
MKKWKIDYPKWLARHGKTMKNMETLKILKIAGFTREIGDLTTATGTSPPGGNPSFSYFEMIYKWWIWVCSTMAYSPQ